MLVCAGTSVWVYVRVYALMDTILRFTNTLIIIIPDATVLTLSSTSVLYCTVCHFLKYGMEDPDGHRPRGESNPDPAAQLMGALFQNANALTS